LFEASNAIRIRDRDGFTIGIEATVFRERGSRELTVLVTVVVLVETDISVVVEVFAASPTATNRLAEIKMLAMTIADAMAR
jgi:hypothetical protein